MQVIPSLMNVQVQAVICSLPNNWENMKMHFTHNESIKTLEDAMRYLELEEDRLMVSKVNADIYMASSILQSGSHASENTKVGISKRIEQILKEGTGKRLTNLEKERRNGSSRRRITCPGSNALTVGRNGILHAIAKSPRR